MRHSLTESVKNSNLTRCVMNGSGINGMTEIEKVGEFGSADWCEACGKAGAKMLQDANLPFETTWGFSETYLYPPERMLAEGRKLSAFHFMIKDGVCSGGDGAPEECLSLDGFHVSPVWGSICNQSRAIYDAEGQKQRGADEKVMYQDIMNYLGRKDIWGEKGGSAKSMSWPPVIVAAVTVGQGFHNIAASMQAPSPEYDGLPVTEMLVPVFSQMTEAQKISFLDLLAIDR